MFRVRSLCQLRPILRYGTPFLEVARKALELIRSLCLSFLFLSASAVIWLLSGSGAAKSAYGILYSVLCTASSQTGAALGINYHYILNRASMGIWGEVCVFEARSPP